MVTQTIPNDLEPTVPIIIINLSNILKLTSTNYLSWKLQIEATLVGYELFKFLDGSHPTPPPTVVKNNESVSNLAYLTWVRQDRLLFGALIDTLEHTIVPLISRTTTSQVMWETLANTFASASRGHIKQLKAQLKTITKGPQSITEFMQVVKVLTDQLAILGDPVKTEDITDKVLEGLDSSYQGVIDAVNARDTPISFAELHEKLINRELTIKAQPYLAPILPPFTILPAALFITTIIDNPTLPITFIMLIHTPNLLNFPLLTTLANVPSLGGVNGVTPKVTFFKSVLFSKKSTLPFVHPVPHLTHPILPKPMSPPLPHQPVLHHGFLTQAHHIMLLMISLTSHYINRMMAPKKL
ncbi:hypothetical protein OSB04_005325 [Centaurea solstitialis]|uniref:Retrotransposon Copia-like N-terminal domain-containing protein n=1 Tax=Centaurea solstitialis TaxID=347529 RepID=A0AA38WPK3_9ASTR|nr:hypothetical protein OSB04_005325 [Centaurea solstitialis]